VWRQFGLASLPSFFKKVREEVERRERGGELTKEVIIGHRFVLAAMTFNVATSKGSHNRKQSSRQLVLQEGKNNASTAQLKLDKTRSSQAWSNRAKLGCI
jgi:hypothetical protein